ncbi:MAG: glycosyltransferase family 4 protein [Synergistaceae bacterium]|jgi:glycosyltransferase involved in cell wall biosynthesis|nr:glycosyltransferase family 4 protein [Synergistaceae bacterium]
MKDFKVLLISLGRRGGVPIYGFEMTRALAKRCQVNVLVASGSDNIEDWRSLPCPRLEVSTYHDRLSAFASFFNIPKLLIIKKYILSCKPDIVYYPSSHTWKPILDRIIPKSAPIVMTVHDPIGHPGERFALINRILSVMEPRKPEGYILLNESQREDFIKINRIPPDRVAIIPHGIFSGYRNSLARLEDFPEFEPLAEHRHGYFLFIGRIVKYKGIETLLKAFAGALDKTDKLLVIAGSGRFSEAESALLEKLPEDRVMVFNRWLSDSDIATLTANSFMTVLPYEGATQSGIIPASAAFGTPSIASDSGGLKEQIADGKTGFIFPAGDAAELEKIIVKSSIMTDDEYREMRENSERHASENWDWDALAEKLAEFLKKRRRHNGKARDEKNA